jgi:hypothetical protein
MLNPDWNGGPRDGSSGQRPDLGEVAHVDGDGFQIRWSASGTAGWSATVAPASASSQNAVVSTTPGSVTRPAARSQARDADLPPVGCGSVATSSSGSTTSGRGVSGPSNGEGGAAGVCKGCDKRDTSKMART